VEKIKCYELNQVMCQSDEQFINSLNRFQTTTQVQSDVDIINNQCFHTPLYDPKLSYLFYMNEAKQNTMNWFSLEVKVSQPYFG